MRYEKPEVVLCESAMCAIESGSNQKAVHDIDSQPNPTDPAYQADE